MPCSVILPVAKVCWKPGTLDSSLVELKDPSVHCMLARFRLRCCNMYSVHTYVLRRGGFPSTTPFYYCLRGHSILLLDSARCLSAITKDTNELTSTMSSNRFGLLRSSTTKYSAQFRRFTWKIRLLRRSNLVGRTTAQLSVNGTIRLKKSKIQLDK
jgi:hypothetical protein